MSDSKLGPGWWQATDGKWYPPESQPAPAGWWQATDGKWYPPQPGEPLPSPAPAAAEPPPSPGEPPPSPAPAAAEKWWLRRVPLWTLILAAVAGIALGAATSNSDNDEATSANSTEDTNTTEDTTTTERAPTTTRRAATTTTAAPTTTGAPTTAPPPAGGEITTFEGSGASTTRPFTVPDGWEIQWNATDFIQIYVYDAGGQLVGIAANQQGSGEGSAFQADGGSFYLQMNAIGSWTVRVVDVN